MSPQAIAGGVAHCSAMKIGSVAAQARDKHFMFGSLNED
jgi:hypothetical protein